MCVSVVECMIRALEYSCECWSLVFRFLFSSFFDESRPTIEQESTCQPQQMFVCLFNFFTVLKLRVDHVICICTLRSRVKLPLNVTKFNLVKDDITQLQYFHRPIHSIHHFLHAIEIETERVRAF